MIEFCVNFDDIRFCRAFSQLDIDLVASIGTDDLQHSAGRQTNPRGGAGGRRHGWRKFIILQCDDDREDTSRCVRMRAGKRAEAVQFRDGGVAGSAVAPFNQDGVTIGGTSIAEFSRDLYHAALVTAADRGSVDQIVQVWSHILDGDLGQRKATNKCNH